MQFPITQKTLREDAQTAEMELIAAQYRGRARVLQAKLFVLGKIIPFIGEKWYNRIEVSVRVQSFIESLACAITDD
ncbi:MAG: hypothetical protein II838_03515 [Lachnospiraceae bacterium]|nr:hypothetical protein [Lachnospiraceae bacterium]